MPTIISNNKSVKIKGSLSMINGKWFLNGEEIDINNLADEVKDGEKEIIITINLASDSIVEHLKIDNCKSITINGSCKHVKTSCGDINIAGDLDGDAHTSCGNITCNNIHGDAHTSLGNINYTR